MELRFPAKGYHKGLGAELQPAGTTPFIQNMRVLDVQDDRVRGGQRGGLQKAYDEQVSGTAFPIVEMVHATTVD